MNRDENNDQSRAAANEGVDSGTQASSRAPLTRGTGINVVRRSPWLAAIAVMLVISAVALTLLLRPASSGQAGRPVPAPTGVPVPTPSVETTSGTQPRPRDITIELSPAEIENAQLKTEVAT